MWSKPWCKIRGFIYSLQFALCSDGSCIKTVSVSGSWRLGSSVASVIEVVTKMGGVLCGKGRGAAEDLTCRLDDTFQRLFLSAAVQQWKI